MSESRSDERETLDAARGRLVADIEHDLSIAQTYLDEGEWANAAFVLEAGAARAQEIERRAALGR